MKQIIITAILAAICTVGGATSFVMNDLPSYTCLLYTSDAADE